jgi:hypothetical protein
MKDGGGKDEKYLLRGKCIFFLFYLLPILKDPIFFGIL